VRMAACRAAGDRRRGPVALTALAFLALALLVAAGCGGTAPASTTSRETSAAPASSTPAIDPMSGLPVIEVVDLPSEALSTIVLIRREGPFPYSQDGSVFQNREGLLPAHPAGWYHEYTVETPGSPDRGPRRIVVGEDGTFYWTDDHYGSFRVIRR
jgi:ribonuclease T1